MVWLIAAGLHPRANATTQRVADDLADRMDYDLGHVRYCLDETASRLGMSRASVKRHVKYLRELGALAWVQHGTRTNIRAAMGLKGYAATATVYAATIPPVFDHALGNRIVGSGYQARIIVDLRDRRDASASPAQPVDNPPVDNPGTEGLEPPSLTVVKEESQVQVESGFNYTSQASRDHESPTQVTDEKRSSKRTGRHALQVAADIRMARQVRPLVNWTQREGPRRLAFALRPLIDRGLDSYGIAGFLHGLCPGDRWQPKAPANYIRAALAERAERADRQQAVQDRYELENAAVGALRARIDVRLNVMDGVRKGLDRYRKTMHARGLDDLSGADTPSTWNAEADILAFLNGSPA